MNDRSALKGILVVLGIMSLIAFWWLTWLILDKVDATDFMYFLFGIYVVFGFIINVFRDKIFDFDNRLKRLEEKVK